ncbi:hypothetical protein Ancab_014619 [Ancistrocladus abbreviatus]
MGSNLRRIWRATAFFCAIDASGRQDVICWNKNGSSLDTSSTSQDFTNISSMAPFLAVKASCVEFLVNTSQAYCWDSTGSGNIDLIPSVFRFNSYSHIAAGKSHVCAIRGSYYSDSDSGLVDCWEIVNGSDDNSIRSMMFKIVVSGGGFSCGGVRDGGVEGVVYVELLRIQGKSSVGGSNESYADSPVGTKFVTVTAGEHHYCGIREDTHGIECWGSFNSAAVPKGSGFFAIASSDYLTCGIREEDLVLDCWFVNDSAAHPDYDPPLQLCSPGLCSKQSCDVGEFAFNASTLNEPDLSSLCVRKDLNICSPCGLNCSAGFFLSSPCTENLDRVCTACSLAKTALVGMSVELEKERGGGSTSVKCETKKTQKKQFRSCIGKPELESEPHANSNPPFLLHHVPGKLKYFRLQS